MTWKVLLILWAGHHIPSGVTVLTMNDLESCNRLGKRIVQLKKAVYEYNCISYKEDK